MLVRSSGSEAVVEVYSGETTLTLNYPLPPFLLTLLLLLNLKDNSQMQLNNFVQGLDPNNRRTTIGVRHNLIRSEQ